MAKACGFRRKTPSHGLFTQFRHRLGKDGYEKVFSMLLKQLLKCGTVEGEVVAVDSTAVKAFSQREISIERVFSRAKEWLLLNHLRIRGPEQAFIHACLSFSAMLTVALTAVKQRQPHLIRSIKHYTTQ